MVTIVDGAPCVTAAASCHSDPAGPDL